MSCDVVDLRDFYTTSLGKIVQLQIQGLLQQAFPLPLTGPLVALGYGVPYMDSFQGNNNFSFMPSYQGVLAWPQEGSPLSTLVSEDQLPLPDRSVSHIFMMHFLENCHNQKTVLKEASRILTNDGRIFLVVPNRRSAWARADQTPFGHGQPYTMTQLCLLLRNSGFTPIRMMRGLYSLPSHNLLLQTASPMLERFGPYCLQKLSGVVCVEAMKEIYATIPARLKPKMPTAIKGAQPV